MMLLVGEGGGGFDQVKSHGGSQKGVMGIDRLEKVGGQKATIAPLLAQGDRRGRPRAACHSSACRARSCPNTGPAETGVKKSPWIPVRVRPEV